MVTLLCLRTCSLTHILCLTCLTVSLLMMRHMQLLLPKTLTLALVQSFQLRKSMKTTVLLMTEFVMDKKSDLFPTLTSSTSLFTCTPSQFPPYAMLASLVSKKFASISSQFTTLFGRSCLHTETVKRNLERPYLLTSLLCLNTQLLASVFPMTVLLTETTLATN